MKYNEKVKWCHVKLDLNLYWINGALALIVLVSGYVC